LKGKRYTTDKELVDATEAQMRTINEEHALQAICNLFGTWQEIIDIHGEYITK
jgi:hypothetical protein